jgi:hypothetical protein
MSIPANQKSLHFNINLTANNAWAMFDRARHPVLFCKRHMDRIYWSHQLKLTLPREKHMNIWSNMIGVMLRDRETDEKLFAAMAALAVAGVACLRWFWHEPTNPKS